MFFLFHFKITTLISSCSLLKLYSADTSDSAKAICFKQVLLLAITTLYKGNNIYPHWPLPAMLWWGNCWLTQCPQRNLLEFLALENATHLSETRQSSNLIKSKRKKLKTCIQRKERIKKPTLLHLCDVAIMFNWWVVGNKTLSGFLCNINFSFSFTREYRIVWKENSVIDQESF